MDYFIPKLWLGITAASDKCDNNVEDRNVYELFDYQIINPATGKISEPLI